jgi:cleavage and polyadenylation specificity factor subunit 1
MKTVSLRSEETVSGLKGYVAAGTCLMQGEEVTCRGRVRGQQVGEGQEAPGSPSAIPTCPLTLPDPDHGCD